MEKVVSVPCHQELLSYLHNLNQFCGIALEVDCSAYRRARVPVFIATATSAWASAGASLVP